VALRARYRAACHYHPARGNPFAALAGICIRNALHEDQTNWRPFRRRHERRVPVAPKEE
jgi:hypothetical protein